MVADFPLIDPAGPVRFAFFAPDWSEQEARDERAALNVEPYRGPGATRILWVKDGRIRPFGGEATYRPGHAQALSAWLRRHGHDCWTVVVPFQLSLLEAA